MRRKILDPVSMFLMITSRFSNEGLPRTLIISKTSPAEIVAEAPSIGPRARIFQPLDHICSDRHFKGAEVAIVLGRGCVGSLLDAERGSLLGGGDDAGGLIAGRFKVT